jgi:hypothetical protein
MQLGKTITRTVNTTIERNLRAHDHISVHDQLQPGALNRYGGEWLYNFARSGSVRAGIDRLLNLQTSQAYYVPMIGLALKFPHDHELQLTYRGEHGAHMLSFVIGGRLANRREVHQDLDGHLALAVSASIEGRVFEDADLNGVFAARTDMPLSDVTVWLDDDTSVKTDADGMFRFDHVKAGAHRLRADLADVPADMVFADDTERRIAVLPYRSNTQDFAVVHTGSITGKVTYLDYVQDRNNPIEQPMAEARIIADKEHDTYSDGMGSFTLGSLPPGIHHLRIAPETIPEGYTASPEEIEVHIHPAEVIRGVHFQLAVTPKQMIIKDLPKQQSQILPH